MKLFFLTLPLIIIAGAGFLFLSRKQTDNAHYHAGFAVYIDGRKQDYSGPQYMSLERCVSNGQADNSRTGEAHLHDNVGDVVHVHHTAVPWQELFRTMGVKFPDEPVTGYRNGKEVPGIMNELIRPNDSVVIVVGSKTDVKPSDYVSRDRIRSVESRSENCAN